MVWILHARERAHVSTTPPEAKPEYSRADSGPGGVSDARPGLGRATPTPGGAPLRFAVWGAGLIGALLLVIAEFTTLFEVHVVTSPRAVASVNTGSHHSYALIPIAVLALVLTVAGWRARSRPALAALGLLGLIALLIALVGDLPDAQTTGLVGSAATHFTSASSSASVGLYLETLGAVALLIAGGLGLLLIPRVPRPPRARRGAAEEE
jgi:hypothetical protein